MRCRRQLWRQLLFCGLQADAALLSAVSAGPPYYYLPHLVKASALLEDVAKQGPEAEGLFIDSQLVLQAQITQVHFIPALYFASSKLTRFVQDGIALWDWVGLVREERGSLLKDVKAVRREECALAATACVGEELTASGSQD